MSVGIITTRGVYATAYWNEKNQTVYCEPGSIQNGRNGRDGRNETNGTKVYRHIVNPPLNT